MNHLWDSLKKLPLELGNPFLDLNLHLNGEEIQIIHWVNDPKRSLLEIRQRKGFLVDLARLLTPIEDWGTLKEVYFYGAESLQLKS